MPPRRRAPGTPREWLARAKSNLIMDEREKTEDLFWEDLALDLAGQVISWAEKLLSEKRGTEQ